MNRQGNFVIRGQTSEDAEPAVVNLFDATYRRGFRVVDFRISSESKTAVGEVCGVLGTVEDAIADADHWDYSDQTQIAWASGNTGGGTSSKEDQYSLSDSSIIVVDQLFVFVHHAAGSNYKVNYYAELEPVDLKSYEWALSFVQNQSQAVS